MSLAVMAPLTTTSSRKFAELTGAPDCALTAPRSDALTVLLALTSPINFRTDVTASGPINASDVSVVKSASGMQLP